MKKYKYEFEIDEINLTCENCPFSYEEYYEDDGGYSDSNTYCSILKEICAWIDHCPVKEVK